MERANCKVSDLRRALLNVAAEVHCLAHPADKDNETVTATTSEGR
jgi:hypothetical protein